jgi:tetratricopeptide (TPR) repeat protein
MLRLALLLAIPFLSFASRAQDCYVAFLHAGLNADKAGKYKDAIKDFTLAIECNAKPSEPYFNRALAKQHLGQYLPAINDYNMAAARKPRDPVVYYNRGNVWKELGQWYHAIQDYDNALLLRQTYKEAFLNRGDAKMDGEDYTGAIADFKKLTQIDPKYVKAYHNMGDAYIELKKDYSNAFTARGISYYDLKALDLALADFSKAIELNTDDGLAYWYRGDTERQLHLPSDCGDFAKAEELDIPGATESIKKYYH